VVFANRQVVNDGGQEAVGDRQREARNYVVKRVGFVHAREQREADDDTQGARSYE
jgi:hypothetical protein